jgi:hypothetical protein
MKLPKDFKEFVELMISNNVRFVMIGGYAYNLYRNPRATGDIDFFVSSDEKNQSELRSALKQFGFGSVLPPSNELLMKKDQVLMLGRSPFRIDLLVSIDGVSFEEVENSCRIIPLDGLEVPVISPEMLLKNKQSTGRTKDLVDAEELEKWLASAGESE